jgi:hypothetical protein
MMHQWIRKWMDFYMGIKNKDTDTNRNAVSHERRDFLNAGVALAPDLVILGQVKADIMEVRDLGSTIAVTIALDR